MVLSACEGRSPSLALHELAGQTMGTSFSVKVVVDDNELNKPALDQQINEALTRIDNRMSTWKAGSELSRFNADTSTDWVPVSSELCGIIEAALEISDRTEGAFDVTVGPLVNLWGFGPASGDMNTLPAEDEIASTMLRVGFRNLQADCSKSLVRKLRADIYVDLSAFAKGYAVDELASLLNQQGLEHYLVEVGGELRMHGHNARNEKWAVAIEKPADFSRTVQTVIHLTDRAMATSGDYRNYFEIDGQRYSHTIDSRTGRPVKHNAAAVTVVSDSAGTADALATALLVMGPEAGIKYAERENIAAYFLLRDGETVAEQASSAFSVLIKQ